MAPRLSYSVTTSVEFGPISTVILRMTAPTGLTSLTVRASLLAVTLSRPPLADTCWRIRGIMSIAGCITPAVQERPTPAPSQITHSWTRVNPVCSYIYLTVKDWTHESVTAGLRGVSCFWTNFGPCHIAFTCIFSGNAWERYMACPKFHFKV